MEEKPLATPEYEQFIAELFSREMQPEEYAARFGHRVFCFSGADFRYRDQALQEWIYRFYRAMVEPGALDRYQTQFLSDEEMAQIRAEEEIEDL